MDEPISLADAAREAYFSPFHFHRVFVQRYGYTPHEFVTNRRIEAVLQDDSGNWFSMSQPKPH